MAYHIYQTSAIVLGRTPIGESNAYISLLTRELGLIRAVARSVRSEKSKLRYALQRYTECEVSLVRGKDVWRITGAVPIFSHSENLSNSPLRRALVAKIARLLMRIHGEERNEFAFDSVQSLFAALGEGKVDDLELITALRLLYALGYVGNEATLSPYVETSAITDEALIHLEKDRDTLVAIVNRALAASNT